MSKPNEMIKKITNNNYRTSNENFFVIAFRQMANFCMRSYYNRETEQNKQHLLLIVVK